MKIKVALVEDHHIVREGLASIISKIPKVEFVFSAENGQDFLNRLVQHSIDLVFLDLEMPTMDGIQTFLLLKENHPEIKALLGSIEKWSGYQKVYDEYFEKYYNEKQIKIEAIGKVLAKALVKQYKESAKDGSIFSQARKAIASFFSSLNKLNPFLNTQYY